MRIVNKKIILVSILLVVVTTGVLICGLHSDKETQLDSVSLKEEVNNDMFAIMLEQDDGTYKESTDNTWPETGYTYDASKSGCVDVNGNKIENALVYNSETKIATVETRNTSYCYLYFSLPPNLYKLCSEYNNINECAINENLEDVTGIWNSTLDSDGYRYVGTNPDNYICFGTNSTEECTSDTEKYMYRIIGIFEDESGVQHLKLIKKEPLNTAYRWHEGRSSELYLTNWNETVLHAGLNGSYYLSNTTEYPYMADTTWTNKIAEWKYIMADSEAHFTTTPGADYNFTSVRASYLHEMNIESKVNETCYVDDGTLGNCANGGWEYANSSIGLMYVSDYLLSLGSSVLDYIPYLNTTFTTGWLNGKDDEWTMTLNCRDSSSTASLNTYTVPFIGITRSHVYSSQLAVRPVFYTITDTKLSGGSGTITNPYLIAS